MRFLNKNLLYFGMIICPQFAVAQDIKGISFSHENWEVYCSNIGTCRAAGYSEYDEVDHPATILLVRKAGANQQVSAEFALSGDESELAKKVIKNIHFYVNEKDLGLVVSEQSNLPITGTLTQIQTNNLLKYANQSAKIEFKNNDYRWIISDKGMTASLLKMDDFQKRLGTTGALVKKGQKDESNVLKPQIKLIVKKVKTSNKPYLTLTPKSKQYKPVLDTLMQSKPKPEDDIDSCEGNVGEDGSNQNINLYHLTNHKVLASMLCWRAAYNEGYGMWVLDESLKGKANFITNIASGFEDSTIDSFQKGRGIGDCISTSNWVWDGQQFVKTQDMWTGMCIGIAAGGVWQLDRIESIVK